MPAIRSNQNLRTTMTFRQRTIRRWYTFVRICKTGCVNFVRNAWLSIAAIAMMVITLTIILFSIIINETFVHTVAQITDRIDISVYLKDDVSKERTDRLIDEVRRLQNVREVNYLSKADALEVYKGQNANNPELLAAISQTDNPLPASLQIKPKDPNDIASIRDFLERDEIKTLQSDETSYSGNRKEAIDKITKTARFFGQIGVIAVLVFAVVSVLIIFNTIQMTIFNRRDELGIMQLLGATRRYIQGPFIVEAFLYGIIAGLISLLISNIILQVQTSVFEVGASGVIDLGYTISYLGENFPKLLALQLGLGVLIAVASTAFATRRHLRKYR